MNKFKQSSLSERVLTRERQTESSRKAGTFLWLSMTSSCISKKSVIGLGEKRESRTASLAFLNSIIQQTSLFFSVRIEWRRVNTQDEYRSSRSRSLSNVASAIFNSSERRRYSTDSSSLVDCSNVRDILSSSVVNAWSVSKAVRDSELVSSDDCKSNDRCSSEDDDEDKLCSNSKRQLLELVVVNVDVSSSSSFSSGFVTRTEMASFDDWIVSKGTLLMAWMLGGGLNMRRVSPVLSQALLLT